MRLTLLALAALLLAPACAVATEIPPGYRVAATRLSDGAPFLGHLADPREGRSWLWITEAPYATVGAREEVFLRFDVSVERVTLANGTLLERWTLSPEGAFTGLRAREEDPTGSTEWGTGSGVIGGFAVQAYAR